MTPEEIATLAVSKTLGAFEKQFEKLKMPEIQKVITVDKPAKFSLTEINRASTTANARPSTPNMEFSNPRDSESIIEQISVVPDANFRSEGMVEIQVNDAPVYRTKSVGAFIDTGDDTTVFKRGKLVNNGDTIKVFIWNGVDTDSVALTVKITFGEVVR